MSSGRGANRRPQTQLLGANNALLLNLAACCCLLLASRCGPLAASQAPEIVDESADASIELIAKLVCSPGTSADKLQIGRVSTIAKLADYLATLAYGHELTECRDANLTPIVRLRNVLERSKANVCSDDKVSLIEDFHVDYISTNAADVTSREQSQQVQPAKLLAVFFMHYALHVSTTCQRSLINNLEWDLGQHFRNDEDLLMSDNGAIDKLTRGLFATFASLYSVGSFDDVVLIWDLIDESALDRRADEQPGEGELGVDEVTGAPVRMLAKMKDIKMLYEMKRKCAAKLRPVYEKLILPIVRLSNLGYINRGSEFARELDELRTNALVKKWYAITQMCEALAPVKFYQDASMAPAQIVLIGADEAERLTSAAQLDGLGPAPQVVRYEPSTNSLEGVDWVSSVASDESQYLVRHIKAHMTSRDRSLGRAMGRIVSDVRRSLKNCAYKFLFSRKSARACQPPANQSSVYERQSSAHDVRSCSASVVYVQDDLGSMASKSLAGLTDDQLLHLEGAGRRSDVIKRDKKRRRKYDTEYENELRNDQLSYQHTKSWPEIFASWKEALGIFKPPKWLLILTGVAIVVFLLFIIVMMAGTLITSIMG